MAKIERYCAGKRGLAPAVVAVPALAHPGWLIEVEAIAFVCQRSHRWQG